MKSCLRGTLHAQTHSSHRPGTWSPNLPFSFPLLTSALIACAIFFTALVTPMSSSVYLSVTIPRLYLYARPHSICLPVWMFTSTQRPFPITQVFLHEHTVLERLGSFPFSGELANYWALWTVQEGLCGFLITDSNTALIVKRKLTDSYQQGQRLQCRTLWHERTEEGQMES